MKTELNGHSGCGLKLFKQYNTVYVKKSSKEIEYNERLKAQCKKQKEYKADKLKVVSVLREGYANGLFYFDMEYISGITLAEYMRNISLSEIQNLTNLLMEHHSRRNFYDRQAKKIFLKKIKEIEQKIDLTNSSIKEAVKILEEYDWSYVIHSNCHGDFTLENMIMANNSIYLIDFLDSFYDSWQIDFAKMLQDIELYWHYRNEKEIDINLALRLLILKENLIDRVLEMDEGEHLLETIYHILLLNVLRIFPYTKEEKTWIFLIAKLDYVKNIIIKKDWL